MPLPFYVFIIFYHVFGGGAGHWYITFRTIESQRRASSLRFSSIFEQTFSSLMFDVDSTSRIQKQTPWTFDMESALNMLVWRQSIMSKIAYVISNVNSGFY